MAPRQEIIFPFQGRSDGTAKGRQPALSTSEAKNVVGWIEGEERQQGGQRAGLSPYASPHDPVDTEGKPIQLGMTLSYDRSAFRYAQLGNPLVGGLKSDLGTEWAETSPDSDETFHVRVDEERNSFWLSKTLVVKRNADGEELFQVPIPLAQGQSLARVFELDADGNLYLGGSSQDTNRECSIFKLEPREDGKGMDLAWEVTLDGTEIAGMAFEFGRLLVAVNDDGQFQRSRVVGIDDLAGDQPNVSDGLEAPYPIGGVASGPRGSYITCLPNNDRGPDALVPGFVEPVVDWTPYDVTDASQRLFAWLDAMELGNYTDAQPVPEWPDRRFVEGVEITDDLDRRLIARYHAEETDLVNGVPEGPLDPRYFSNAVQALPGLSFNRTTNLIDDDPVIELDNGNALYCQPRPIGSGNPLRSDKQNADGKLPASSGIWPITKSHTFSTFMLFRWTENDIPCVVWNLAISFPDPNNKPPQGYFAVIVNYDTTGLAVGDNIPQGWSAPADRPSMPGRVVFLRNNQILAIGDAVTTGSVETRMAMVSIVRNSAGNCRFRVNGADAETGFTIDDSQLQSQLEVFGNRVYWEDTARPLDTESFFTKARMPNVDSFTGTMHEFVTVMGASSSFASPHDTDFGAPGTENTYERVEGYLAHKWGIAANVLPVAHPYRTTPPSGDGGFTESLEGELATALRSRYGILARLESNLIGFRWVIDGAGMGYDVLADQDGGVVCAGPRLADPNGLSEAGPQGRILLKGIDRGLRFDWPEPSRGRVVLSAIPPNGSRFTIDDGVASEVFEFNTVEGSVVAGRTWIDTSSGDTFTITERIRLTITFSAVLDVWCEYQYSDTSFPVEMDLFSRRAPDATVRPIVTSGMDADEPEFSVAYGMTGPGAVPAGTWDLRVTPDMDLVNPDMQLAADSDNAVYVPFAVEAKLSHLVKYSENGEDGTAKELWTHKLGGETGTAAVYAVAVDPRETDLFPATGPEYLWVASSNVGADKVQDLELPTQRRMRAVGATPINGPARSTVTLAVSEGSLYQLRRDGQTSLVSADLLGTDSVWVQAASLFGDVFFVDRGTYKVYNLKRGTVRDWQAAGSGEIPEGARLIAAYRGRVVLARAKEDPHNLHASRQGDPFDWDLGAPSDDPTRAFSGSELETAKNPDIINTIAPFFDDRLVIGGDRTISIFSGDLSELGRADLFTDATGMAYGATHALDPEGFIYFYGSRGGVWAMSPAAEGRSSPPVELTDQTIAKELGQLDLSSYRPHLLWDQESRSLHVYVVRRDAGVEPAVQQHWVFEKRSRAWWPMVIDDPWKQPSTAWLSDGDLPDDRIHLVGCEDGRVRWWNPEAVWDDGTRIESSVLIGPLLPQSPEFESKLTSLELTLASGAVWYQLFGSDNPNELGPVLAEGRMGRGFSGSLRHRVRGGSLWLRLFNASEAEAWRLDSAFANFEAAGRRRVR